MSQVSVQTMSIRAVVAILVNCGLGFLLYLIYVKHVHLTMRGKSGDAIVPSLWITIAILLIMAAVSGWWFLCRKAA
jgi:hypothetical protein